MSFIKFLILFYLIYEISGHSYDIVFKKFEVMSETDPSFIDFGTLRVLKKSRTEVEFSGTSYLYQKLTNVGLLTITVYRLNNIGVPPLQVFYSQGGFCDQMAKDKQFYPIVVENSNLPADYCPLKPGNYTVNHLIFHLDQFPDVIPPGEYYGTMTYSLNGQIKMGYKTVTSVVPAKT